MSASAPALSHTWKVGRFLVTLTVPPLRLGQVAHASVEWAPHLPERLTTKEITAYRTGLAAALNKLGMPGSEP